MAKSPDAFRTISEVADWIGVHAHVLRFWESKFSQVKPVKRAGGRRYYRPSDMQLLSGIKKLLHDDGMTIKGVQKVLREQGVAAVAAMSRPLEDAPDGDQTATAEGEQVQEDAPEVIAETPTEEEAIPDDAVIQLPPRRKRPNAAASAQMDMFEAPTSSAEDAAEPEPVPSAAPEEAAEEPAPSAPPEPPKAAPPPPVRPRSRPLPPAGTPVLDALKQLEPGQVAPIKIRAIHDQLVALRARMDPQA